MIVVRSVRWKNFLSTGNTFTEIPLTTHEHTLIIGENGSGKSTLLDALCFGLFNRPFRKINKPSLVNSINGRDCLVEVLISIDGVAYRIIRGIKPNIFEIYQDGILINQDAESRDYQEYLESAILKMNYKSFTQIAVLGSASFTPFMQLSSSERRAIIEDLLDIQIFSTMNSLLKEHITTNKESLSANKLMLESAHEKVELQKKHVVTLSENHDRLADSLRHERTDNLEKMNECEQAIAAATTKISAVVDSLSDKKDVQSKLTKLNKLEAQIQHTLSKQQKSLSFFEEHDHCPTCQQGIDQSFRQEQITNLRKKTAESLDGIQKLEQKVKELEVQLQHLDGIERTIRTLETDIASWKRSIEQIRDWVQSIDTKITNLRSNTHSSAVEQQQLAIYEQTVIDLDTTRKTLLVEKQYCDAASLLLKDTGIKTKIIQQYLPVINTLVNKYLLTLDFSVNFMLDESFDETIKSRYRDEFQYASFSEGEKQRIDMALMLTWRAVAKLKNSMNTNLLILDEVFDSSLDLTGTEELLKILTVLEGTNVFVISHRGDMLQDKFQHVIRFRKQNNFSSQVIV
jgi:DNA repair exonuclease SbcCD ATPase subunit